MEKATRDRLTGAVILVAAAAILVPEMLSGPGRGARTEAEPVAETDAALTTWELPLGPANASGALRGPGSREPAAQAQAAPSPATAPPVAQAPAPPATETPPAAPAREASVPAPAPATAPSTRAAQQGSSQPSRESASRSTQAAASTAASRPASQTQTQTQAQAQTRPAAPAPAPASAAAGGDWWVQLGSFASEQNANGLASRMRARGFNIQVSKVKSGGKDLFRVRAGPEKSREAATALKNRLAAAGEQGTLVAP